VSAGRLLQLREGDFANRFACLFTVRQRHRREVVCGGKGEERVEVVPIARMPHLAQPVEGDHTQAIAGPFAGVGPRRRYLPEEFGIVVKEAGEPASTIADAIIGLDTEQMRVRTRAGSAPDGRPVPMTSDETLLPEIVQSTPSFDDVSTPAAYPK